MFDIKIKRLCKRQERIRQIQETADKLRMQGKKVSVANIAKELGITREYVFKIIREERKKHEKTVKNQKKDS